MAAVRVILLQFLGILSVPITNNSSTCSPPTSIVVSCLIAFQGYGGVVVLDDIRAVKWPLMQEYWRNGVPTSVTKVDMTEYGHSTGTGALVFDGKRTNILIAD